MRVLFVLLAASLAWGRPPVGRSQFIADYLKHYPAPAASAPAADGFYERIAAAARDQTQQNITYDPRYFKIAYPGGDIPAGLGVCTDVVIRAYRKAGVDLQVQVHEDMSADFAAYPNMWDRSTPDSNIDHRRVPNLMVFFGRRGAAVPITKDAADYRPGDVVAWDLGGGTTHIGMVVDGRSPDGARPLISHNIGEGPKLEDALFAYRIIGHFRYAGGSSPYRSHPIISKRRLELTRRYFKAHYGVESAELKAPQIVVVHATEIPTLAATLKSFDPDVISSERKYLNEFGDVNVGVHFVVDTNGDVYSLLPLDVAGRHAIGFNHVSIGIENVGMSAQLTHAQMLADAALVQDLLKRRPTLRFLVGHHEYVDKTLPHYRLFKELDSRYKPTEKSDPGAAFMKDLRAELASRNVRLQD